MKYTPQDYYDADEALDQVLESWEGGTVHRREVDQAESKLPEVIAYLRSNDTMPKTRHELLEEKLDRLFPDAASREMVEYQDERYQRRFKPLKRGKGGGVVEWERYWLLKP
ncbi:hypothetical protein ACT3UM_21430 [Halomonas sp. AOP13-D3-9]